MGRKGSEMSPSKRYPLRSTHNSGRFLRSATNKSNTTSSEPLNDSAPAQPSLRKRKSGSSSGSPSNTVRVLRSASKNKVDLCSKSLNDSTPGELDANKRKGIRPSKATSPISSVRVLRSASKNKDEVCSETLKCSTAGEQVANERKLVTPSKVESPNNSVRVLRSASKNKNEAYSEPLNDNTIAQPSAKKRKSGSPLKVGSPASSARVLRSNSKRANETFNVPQHDIPATQQASRKGKSDTAPKGGSLKPVGRVLPSASEKKDAYVEPLRDGFVLALPSTHHVKQQPLNVSTPVQPVVKRIKSGGSSKECSHKKEDYLKIRQRVRYVLNRMNYEQSLIQAYAGEGWKGQSLEKIRPEKELERAKAEILRCKIKIREAFQNMESLISEGKLEESLFDSAGQIFSEDIFCSICGSKDVTSKNDIILCDGACDRGFHQNCLSPPLRTEDIPPGNEGWFCPACVCKIDCIDALNELQGSKLSVHDSWERVFPEAASLANGSKQHDASDLPLDDSEDNCYNPGLDKMHIVKGGRSSADNDGNVDGFPSDDSEDDDFDPAGPDSSEHQKAESHYSESDFTSDSDDFCAEIAKSCGQGAVSPLSNVNEEFQNRLFMETELDQDVVLPVCSRRQVERLDYKKLYDEAYGEESSSSSDDEEWSGKEKLEDSETDGSVRPAKRHSRRASIEHPNSQYTQSERQYGSVSEQQAEIHRSNGSNGSARHFAPIVRQKLKDQFENDSYPSRATKESLARELGLTFIQVDKWFASTRHSSRIAAAKKGNLTENHTTGNDGTAVESTEVNDEVLVELTADRNGMTHEEMMVQNNPNEGNKKDILLSRAETKTDAYTTEASSDDKEWSGTSISQKELEDAETDSHAASNHAKRLTRRALVEPHNNKHTPLSEQLHVSVNDQQTEAPYFNGSSSKARKNRFGPVVSQKLKGHFEKDPYPNRSTIQNLAQELGLTSIQVRKWFSSTRHYSSVSAAKKGKGPGSHTNEKNDSTTLDSKREKKSDNRAMENLTKDRNDSLSRKLMLQINLNEGNNDDIDNMFSQHPSCEEALVTTPTAISIEVGPPGYMPGENQGKGAVWSTGFEQGLTTTPTPVSSEVGPQGYGYGTGENQGYSGSWNIISDSEHGILMTPTVTTMPIPREVGATGYGPGESQGNNASWNTSSEHRLFMTPSTSSREACPPGYGPGEGQVNSASWNTCSDQLVDVAPSTISRQVSQLGYGPRENQVSGASWNTSTGQRSVMTPSTIPRVDPPGYWPGKNQGNSASWNNRREQSFFMTPTTTLSEVGPPGYGPGENKGNGASANVGSPNDRPSEKQELADEARKKAIARELRRMKKFR